MGEILIYNVASGCGVTDFLLNEGARDFCDSWISCAGILLIIALIVMTKNLRLRRE